MASLEPLFWNFIEETVPTFISKIKSYVTAWTEEMNDYRNPTQLVLEKINKKNVITRIAEVSRVFFLYTYFDYLHHWLNSTFSHAIFQQHCLLRYWGTRFSPWSASSSSLLTGLWESSCLHQTTYWMTMSQTVLHLTENYLVFL